MPFPFILPTTSPLSLTAHFESSSHPSLPVATTTHRAPFRSALKAHKRLPPQAQSSNLSALLNTLEAYIPYLLSLDGGLAPNATVDVVLTSTPSFSWRPTLTTAVIPGRELARINLSSLEYELYFTIATLSYLHTLLARNALQPLYSTTAASPSQATRTTLITTATKHLLLSSSIHLYLAMRADNLRATSPLSPPALDIAPTTLRALSSLAHAEATLLAVLKDDPYPAAVAQERNEQDKEWMIRAPTIPKVRAHLFARLCLAGSAHAATAAGLLAGNEAAEGKLLGRVGAGKIDDALLRYVEDLRRVGRARACRFLGIDRDLDGKTGEAIAWLRAGMGELGLASSAVGGSGGGEDSKKRGLGFARLKSSFSEKKEERRVQKGADWGGDAGRAEEARVIAALEAKWTKQNDTVNTQLVPEAGPLVAAMPSGREIYTVSAWAPPVLDAGTLQRMKAPPEEGGEVGSSDSEGEERDNVVVGAFPASGKDYGSSGAYY